MTDDSKAKIGVVNAPGNLKIVVDDDVAQGIYSNFQVIGNNETEFILDFAYIQPNQPRGKVRARMILSPKHAKSLLGMLTERVRDYEGNYGTISLPVRSAPPKGGSGLPN
jgi:hypothetical protein